VRLPWNYQSFEEKAKSILDMFDGLTEEDHERIYDEWETKEYPDNKYGVTESLSDLQQIAYLVMLEKAGKLDEYKKLVEDDVQRLKENYT
jgi:hypothetical protein